MVAFWVLAVNPLGPLHVQEVAPVTAVAVRLTFCPAQTGLLLLAVTEHEDEQLGSFGGKTVTVATAVPVPQLPVPVTV